MKSKSLLYFRYFSYIKPIAKLPIVKNYAPTIFTLLTATLLVFFAIKPTLETILVLQKKLADSNEVLQKITNKAQNLSLGRENYDNLDSSIKNKISQAVPDTVNLKSLISLLEQSARLSEASISALQIQPFVMDTKIEESIGTIQEISFIFNVEGNYDKLTLLLQNLKTSSRLISIDSLSLSKVTDSSSLIMSLSGKAYYLK
ncbi:type 4a pilus biogenesis protein PilO [Patescibacteria group bacterium]|nr:type 4a pilus biogenesis protein PilO [Patescibacteria group bacterium]